MKHESRQQMLPDWTWHLFIIVTSMMKMKMCTAV